MILQIVALVLLVVFTVIILYVKFAPQFGAPSKGKNLERIRNSPNYQGGKFRNLLPTPMAGENNSMWKNGLKFLKKSVGRSPDKPIETVKFDKIKFIEPHEEISISWFGHSSVILNIEGKIILTDPVFSEKASPFSFMGVKRFDYTNQYSADDLPDIDMVLISHDHYDHLDYKTILQIHQKVKKFYVPLGVSAHLTRWGIPISKIVEMDWWEEMPENNNFKLIATPSRHFSGRAGYDKDYTLWCSWIVKTDKHAVYYSGDSGYGNHFKEIGEKYGPFDLSVMECGQYNEGWPYIHMMPEQSIQAHIDLNAGVILPVHWGKFNLSLHTWTEPINRAINEANRLNVNLLKATAGEIYSINKANKEQDKELEPEVDSKIF